ncbi:hypothetical protein HMPREF9151_00840 [Hoylesella saccharolytica F0055]|uniref:Uncharacterized protein n=1 Tax=Hoylesella saccharolytica F0055 TaxID=1127699 RepID=L1NFN5_9BACT|nr:hypothetical protein HMPREF9151_00840 [Hoylesella saccharolytica F0055]
MKIFYIFSAFIAQKYHLQKKFSFLIFFLLNSFITAPLGPIYK